ncbi:unnamed protein product [Microthlaspi erraticum]|uniref:Uncharacterized protein n=1 Tax=Microthlaspi erraticum TaxID=1685480 RepID=A0A6D2IUZ2_9BRAS|nr:unnamed protein product [Microthlaspi erraticum]
MSDAKFIIYYGGKFVRSENGVLAYYGGSVHEHFSPAKELFNGLPEGLYRQRVWYKLPYEDKSELKILCEGLDNFERMCEAAKWTSMVEVYMERDEDYEENDGIDNEEGRDAGNEIEREAAN